MFETSGWALLVSRVYCKRSINDKWQQFFGCDDYVAWEELEAESRVLTYAESLICLVGSMSPELDGGVVFSLIFS
ncbi:hypothetical protein NC652_028966 [Populus alba x Populus x berolinensis]|nr:hypothetical protein NC652_028966 [Populus alba x Populus x berolinensis]